MRCGCPECGTLMIHEESGRNLCCCCPDCGYRCSACLGTDSVLSREDILGCSFRKSASHPPITTKNVRRWKNLLRMLTAMGNTFTPC